MVHSPAVRIAVSGTHCSGKSTLIEDFLAAHPDYAHEPEPYELLGEEYAEPDADGFLRQLEVSVERLSTYAPGASVIAERSPLDFLAYILALIDLGREPRDCAALSSAGELVAAGLAHVDLLVILHAGDVAAPESEDPELREAMDGQLLDLVAADPYALFAGGRPRTLELHGTPRQRLGALERDIGQRGNRQVR